MRNRERYIGDLMERAALFQLLALLFNAPAAGHTREVEQAFMRTRREPSGSGKGLAQSLREAERAWAQTDDTLSLNDYRELFVAPLPISLRETTYIGNKRLLGRVVQLADVKGLYQTLRFRPQGGGDLDMVDHLCTELAFVAYLLRREAYAITRGLRTQEGALHQLGSAFLKQHLSRWTPLLCRALAERGVNTPYRASAVLLATVILTECRRRRIQSRSRAGVPRRMPSRAKRAYSPVLR